MTRRDYDLLVRVIRPMVPQWKPQQRASYGSGYYSALRGLVHDLADMIGSENKAFDKDRFITDCGFVVEGATKENAEI